MASITHFEIRADVPNRAATFYSKVFGWNVNPAKGRAEHWTINAGKAQAGVGGSVAKRTNRDAIILRFDVASVDDFLKKVHANGGKVVAPKKYIPGLGIIAYCHDTEGNTFEVCEKRR